MLTASFFSRTKRPRANSDGWLGIDFGCAAIKAVQLRRHRGQIECLQNIWLESPDFAEEPNLPFGRSSDNPVPTAIVTSMRWVEMEADTSWDLSDPASSQRQHSTSLDCSAILTPTVTSQQPLQPRRVRIIPERSHWLGNQFLQSGYEPKLIDAPPWALSRALTLFDKTYLEGTGAILDWAATSPLLVIQHCGIPQFARTINCGSLEQITETLRQRLNLDLSATTHYLHRLGTQSSQTSTAKRQGDWVKSLITPTIQQLADELNRSFTYLRWQCRELLPKSLVISGGVASIPMFMKELQLALDIPIHTWTLPTCDGHKLGPISAQAAALSALEWMS